MKIIKEKVGELEVYEKVIIGICSSFSLLIALLTVFNSLKI